MFKERCRVVVLIEGWSLQKGGPYRNIVYDGGCLL